MKQPHSRWVATLAAALALVVGAGVVALSLVARRDGWNRYVGAPPGLGSTQSAAGPIELTGIPEHTTTSRVERLDDAVVRVATSQQEVDVTERAVVAGRRLSRAAKVKAKAEARASPTLKPWAWSALQRWVSPPHGLGRSPFVALDRAPDLRGKAKARAKAKARPKAKARAKAEARAKAKARRDRPATRSCVDRHRAAARHGKARGRAVGHGCARPARPGRPSSAPAVAARPHRRATARRATPARARVGRQRAAPRSRRASHPGRGRSVARGKGRR